MKQILSLLLALALAASLLTACGSKPAPSPAESQPAETQAPAETPAPSGSVLGEDIDVNGKLVILHTNDVHGRAVQTEDVLGYTAVAALMEQVEAEGGTVLLLDAGDASQGTVLVNNSHGALAMDFMNAVGYHAMALGNHEYDWGCDNVWQLIDRAQFPVLGANIVDRGSGECKMQQSVTFELNGKKIGVFGLDTPETATKVHPDKVRDITVLMEDELYACAQQQADALRADGCDMVILLCHLGVDASTEPNRSIDVLENTTGIDLCVDGHSHTVMEGGEMHNGALLTSTGAYLSNIGWVVVEEDGSMKAGLYHHDQPISEERVAALVNEANDKVREELGKPFAKTEVDLNGERDDNRTGETNFGDLFTDVMVWAAANATGRTVDVGLCNGGSIRAGIPTGDISMLDVQTVFPFGNTLVVLDVTGAELLEALEASTFCTPESLGGFPQVSGLELTIDTTVPYQAGELYPGTTYDQPADPGSRVTIRSVGGKPFDPDAIYTVATNDFLAAGGDTYYAFRYANATARTDTGVLLEDSMADYILNALGGTVGSDYAQPQGRIEIIK